MGFLQHVAKANSENLKFKYYEKKPECISYHENNILRFQAFVNFKFNICMRLIILSKWVSTLSDVENYYLENPQLNIQAFYRVKFWGRDLFGLRLQSRASK